MPAPAITPTAISPNANPSRRCAWSRSLVRPTVRASPPTPIASKVQPPRRPRPNARPSPPLRRAGERRVDGRRVVDRLLDFALDFVEDFDDRVPLPPRVLRPL